MNFSKILNSKDKRTATVKKNIIASFAIKGVSIIVSLLLVPMTLGYVSSELYGIWLTLSSVMMWLSFFDVGFTLGLKNKLAEAIALNNWEKGKSLVSTTYFMMILIFVPICIALELLIPCVNWADVLNVSQQYNSEISKVLYILVAFFCLQMIVNVLTSVVAAYQQVALSNAFPVIGNILSLIAIWFLIHFCPPSLISLAFAISAMPIVVLIISSVILYHKKFKLVSPNIKYIDKKEVSSLFGLGAQFFLIQIQSIVLFQSTNILISNVSGPESVTSYNIAYKYMGIAMMAFNIILTPLWPAFTDAKTKNDFNWMRKVYKKMSILYVYSVFVMIIMAIISPWVYNIWIGTKADISYTMTLFVCIYVIIQNWDGLQVNLINGIGTVKLQTYVTTLGLFLHIPLSLYLGKVLHFQALGVISSMIFINIIYSIFFTLQINKILNKKAIGIWKE